MSPRKPQRSGKRYTLQLPLALAARLEALCEMHPLKKRNQLMVDLLGLGLAQVERAGSTGTDAGVVAAAAPVQADTRQPIYLLSGPFAAFHGLVHKHHLALEHALAQDDPEARGPTDYALDDRV